MSGDKRSIASVYRDYAVKEQNYAMEARFDDVRKIHMAAAAKWIALADKAAGIS